MEVTSPQQPHDLLLRDWDHWNLFQKGEGVWEELTGVEGPCGRGGWEKRTGCRVSRPFWPFPVPSGGEGECRLGVGGFRTLKLSLYKLGKVEGYFWVVVWGRTLRSLTRGSQI